MTLKEMAEKLLTVKNLPADERKTFMFLLEVMGDMPLEGTMYPENETHLRARYEWYFKPDGTLRRAA